MVAYATFRRDVACQKLLNSANVSLSYSQNNTGTVFFWDTVYGKRFTVIWATNHLGDNQLGDTFRL